MVSISLPLGFFSSTLRLFMLTTLISSFIHAQDLAPEGELDWHSIGAFSTELVRSEDGFEISRRTGLFHAIDVSEFILEGAELSVPPLDPRSDGHSFRERVAARVSTWRVVNYVLLYQYRVKHNMFLEPVLKPFAQPLLDPQKVARPAPEQRALPCTLKDIVLHFDAELGVLVVDKLLITVLVPGAENDVLEIEVMGRLPAWQSDEVYYSCLGFDAVCVADDKNVFRAVGNRRKYWLPALAGIDGFEKQRIECTSSYCNSQDKYQDALFATVFPANKPKVSTRVFWPVVYREVEVDPYYSEESAVEGDGEGNQDSVRAFFKFYEFKYGDEREAIPAQQNPFTYYDANGKIYFTDAFHRNAYRVIDGELDEDYPYVVQYFQNSGVCCGTHNRKPGFGLRWSIIDNHKFPLSANTSAIEALDTATMQMDLKTIIIEKGGNEPVAFYHYGQGMSTIPHGYGGDKLLTLFDNSDERVCIRGGADLVYYQPEMLTELFSSKIAHGTIVELELNGFYDWYTMHNRVPEFLKHLSRAQSLKKLIIRSREVFFTCLLTACPDGTCFPPNLETLELYETTTVSHNQDCLRGLFTLVKHLPQLRQVKHLVLHVVGEVSKAQANAVLNPVIARMPNLLDVDVATQCFREKRELRQ